MRNVIFDIGFPPGDQVVFTRALTDLCEQYPKFNIQIKTCCPAIYENNPLVNKKADTSKPEIKPIADNLHKAGYEYLDIVNSHERIFSELVKENKLKAVKDDNVWYYQMGGKSLFKCKQAVRPKIDYEYYRIEYEDIQNSGWSGRHFSSAFYYELEKHLGVKIKQTSLLPEIHLTDEEKKWSNQIEQEFNYRGKFWVLCAGYKADYPLKQWPAEYWQKLVQLLSNKIQFVQIGEKNQRHTHPELEGVFNLVGKTDLRQLIRLAYNMEGAVSHVSLLHHLSAVWKKPCVTIAGGREARRWESYPHTRYLETNGLLSCCDYDGCWMSGKMEEEEGGIINKTCKNLVALKPKCMTMIKPERVAQEIINHYNGGVLSF